MNHRNERRWIRKDSEVLGFIRESNRIEGIHREPTEEEVEEFRRFMGLETIAVADLTMFVNVYQRGAVLRARKGLDVRVGNHLPPEGGPHILNRLYAILEEANNAEKRNWSAAYYTHLQYETLHPFTDGNGRSGRMLWMWMMQYAPLGFLHTFYYQALANSRPQTRGDFADE